MGAKTAAGYKEGMDDRLGGIFLPGLEAFRVGVGSGRI